MKLMINTAHQRFGGAVQVALSFINECRAFPEHEYFVMLGPGLQKLVNQDDFPENFYFEKFDFGAISLRKAYTINRTIKMMEMKYNPDVVISSTGPTYFHSRAPQLIGFNLGLYLYSDSPYVKSFSGVKRMRFLIKKKLHYYFFKRDASAFLTQTDDVNQRVRKALNFDKVYTVTNTASNYYQDWKAYPARLPEKKAGTFRFVTISSYYGHKNLELIPKVLQELRKRGVVSVEFVLTLKHEDFEFYIGAQEGIYNVGPVKPEECPSLYQECDGMFLPTLAECFSASYAEAMIMEKPIVTTSMSFAKSICQDAALYFEPKNPQDAAERIVQLLEDKQLREALVQHGKVRVEEFDSPATRSQKYLDLCQQLVKQKQQV